MSKQILIVEDNATNMELITYLLSSFGYRVRTARNGLTGLQMAQSGGDALILTDVLMPEMDGYELVRRIKQEPALQGTPVVAVTALAMSGDRERILSAGFDGYVAKPIDPQHFIAEVRRFVETDADGDDSDR